MNKIKAKFVALFVAACCGLVCLCIGIAVLQPTSGSFTAKAATAELEADFTNNGQFTIGQFKDGMTYEIVDSTAEGVPEGAEGAVLKITGTGDVGTDSASGAFVTLNFLESKLIRSGVDIIVRVYQPGSMDFRVSKTAGSGSWTYQGTPAKGWSEVTLSAEACGAEDHQFLSTISMGYRRGKECYIDSIKVVDNDLMKEITNDGQFTLEDSTLFINHAPKILEGSAVTATTLPAGYSGAVIEAYLGNYVATGRDGYDVVRFNFSDSEIKAEDVDSIVVRAWVANYDQGTDEVRVKEANSTDQKRYGYNYDLSNWCDIALSKQSIADMTDEDGYLSAFEFAIRDRGQTSYLYIDSIKVVYNKDLLDEFTNKGQFTIELETLSNSPRASTIVCGPMVTTLKPGYSGAVLQAYRSSVSGWDAVRFNFSDSEIKAADVAGIVVRAWVENYNKGDDEVRVKGANGTTRRYGYDYELSDWCDIALTTQSIADMTDENGYLSAFEFAIRDKGQSSYLYIDSITVNMVEYTTYELGKLKFRTWTSGNNFLYLNRADGKAITRPDDGNGGWTARFDLKDGVGITMNGVAITPSVKIPHEFFIGLPAAPEEGDVIKVGGTFYNTDCALKYVVEESAFKWDGETWKAMYKVSYQSSAGVDIDTDYATQGQTYTLATVKTNKVFIGWANDGKLYKAGAEFEVTGDIEFTAVEIDFTMENGAAIRIGDSAETSGIRFTSKFKQEDYNNLLGKYGIVSISYGTLITPSDYLGSRPEPNLEDFDSDLSSKNFDILKIESTVHSTTEDGYVVFRGAMQKIHDYNYNRGFAGRAYMEITFEGDTVWTVYTAFNAEDNVRSISYVAQKYKKDNESSFNDLSPYQQAVIKAYIGTNSED